MHDWAWAFLSALLVCFCPLSTLTPWTEPRSLSHSHTAFLIRPPNAEMRKQISRQASVAQGEVWAVMYDCGARVLCTCIVIPTGARLRSKSCRR